MVPTVFDSYHLTNPDLRVTPWFKPFSGVLEPRRATAREAGKPRCCYRFLAVPTQTTTMQQQQTMGPPHSLSHVPTQTNRLPDCQQRKVHAPACGKQSKPPCLLLQEWQTAATMQSCVGHDHQNLLALAGAFSAATIAAAAVAAEASSASSRNHQPTPTQQKMFFFAAIKRSKSYEQRREWAPSPAVTMEQ